MAAAVNANRSDAATVLSAASLAEMNAHAAGRFSSSKPRPPHPLPASVPPRATLTAAADARARRDATQRAHDAENDEFKRRLRAALDDDPAAVAEVARLSGLLQQGEQVVDGLVVAVRAAKAKAGRAEECTRRCEQELTLAKQHEAELAQLVSELRAEREQAQANTVKLLEMAAQAARAAEAREAEYEKKLADAHANHAERLDEARAETRAVKRRMHAAEEAADRAVAVHAEEGMNAASQLSDEYEQSLIELRLELREQKRRTRDEAAEAERLRDELRQERRAHARTRLAASAANLAAVRETPEPKLPGAPTVALKEKALAQPGEDPGPPARTSEGVTDEVLAQLSMRRGVASEVAQRIVRRVLSAHESERNLPPPLPASAVAAAEIVSGVLRTVTERYQPDPVINLVDEIFASVLAQLSGGEDTAPSEAFEEGVVAEAAEAAVTGGATIRREAVEAAVGRSMQCVIEKYAVAKSARESETLPLAVKSLVSSAIASIVARYGS